MKADYKKIDAELRATLRKSDHLMSNLANAAAILKEHCTDAAWVGFYLLHKDEMFLGPFQGKAVAPQIRLYDTVVGAAMARWETQQEDNAVAVPIFLNREAVGVLLIESDAIDAKDVKELEAIAFLLRRYWRHMFS